MAKGETAMDVKKKMSETILSNLERKKTIELERTIGLLELDSGYSQKFVQSVVDNLVRAGILFVSDDKKTARFTNEELERRGIKYED